MSTIYELAQEEWENDVVGAYLDGKDEGMEMGISQGFAKGRNEGRMDGLLLSAAIFRALKNNEPIEKISNQFNVPIEQINQLRLAL